MKEYPSLRSVLTLKWMSRIATIVFLVFTFFFVYWPNSYGSFFRQSIFILQRIPTYSVLYSQLRTAVYICSLGFGLLLIAAFLKYARDRARARGIAAVSCAWLGFVLQASIGLSLQWSIVAVLITLNSTLLVLFAVTLILLATSLLLLTKYAWAYRFGYLMSLGFFLCCSVGFIIMVRYFALFSTPFPTLMAVMLLTSTASTYYLNKFDLKNSDSQTGVHSFGSFTRRLKTFFTSSWVLAIILASVLVLDSIVFVQPNYHWTSSGVVKKDFYCGVAFCGNTTAEAKLLIDRVKDYTNLLVVDSGPVSKDEGALNEICNYAVDSGLHLIVYFGIFDRYWQIGWLDTAKQRWGEKFLGVYYYDEPGGQVLDIGVTYGNISRYVLGSYDQAADNYVRSLRTWPDLLMLKMRFIRTYTSDYALYWFDYKAGYDVLFAEFGWNYSRQLNVDLCRGAATVQNKNWGVIITWTYNNPPYIESGEELYNDMILAYNNGANYILVFNYPYVSDSSYGILKEEHLEAIEKFSNYTNNNSPTSDALNDRVAYVLPKNFGYGFRGPTDKIWGFWTANALSNEICTNLNTLMERYGTRLDIIYDDNVEPNNTSVYSRFVFWNETVDATEYSP